jgi:hypothetical protein
MRQALYGVLLVCAVLAYMVWTTPEWQVAIGSTALDLARPVAIPLIHLINTPAFIYLLSLLLLLAGVGACVAYWFRIIKPRMTALMDLQAAVRQLPLPSKVEPRPAASALNDLGVVLHKNGMFLTAWATLQAHFRRDDAIPDTPFSSFAASDPTLTEGEHRGLMAALPGYFTSLGLIFTFMGLVAALYFAAGGFRSGNLEDARASIMQLLNASSFKFLTSVSALGSALLISIVHRYAQSRLRNAVNETLGLIESYLALWRQASPPVAGRGEAGDRRVDDLVSALRALTSRLDQLLASRKDLHRDAAE